MDEQDVQKIEKIIYDRKVANGFFNRRSDVFKAFGEVEEKAFADGALSKMTKELIAVGNAVVMNCESCMEWHIHEALKAGATEDQVIEAIGVAIELGGGPATVSARFAQKVLDYYREKL